MGRAIRCVIFWSIVLVALGMRLYGIENPLLDDQAWRQTDTANMAVIMQNHLGNFPDVFFPRLSYDGIDPQRAELEFPLLPYLLAWIWQFVGRADVWGRMLAVGFSLLAVGGMYQLGKNLINIPTGLLAAGLYAVIPLAVYYGRVVMPEPAAQAVSIWALACAANPVSIRFRRVIAPGLLMGFAILAKLPQLMLVPVALILIFWQDIRLIFSTQSNRRAGFTVMGEGLFFLLVVMLGPVIYYVWVHTGSLQENSFITGIYHYQVSGSKPTDWQILDKNIRLGFSGGLVVLALAGVLRLTVIWRRKTEACIALVVWLGIAVAYLALICARIPLDYYLVPVLPLAAILGALALDWLEDIPQAVLGFVVIGLLAVYAHTVYGVKYVYNQAYIVQANWIKENTSPDSVLVLSDPPPMTFYYAIRNGFRLIDSDDTQALGKLNDLEQQIQMAAAAYLVKSPESERGVDFWYEIKRTYREIGPGVFILQKEVAD